jgi:hypothetical protein
MVQCGAPESRLPGEMVTSSKAGRHVRCKNHKSHIIDHLQQQESACMHPYPLTPVEKRNSIKGEWNNILCLRAAH